MVRIINDILGGTNELFEYAEQYLDQYVHAYTCTTLDMQQHTDYDDILEMLNFWPTYNSSG